MRNSLYFKLAWHNMLRSRKTYLPHILATSVISGAFLLMAGMLLGGGMENTPSGDTARIMFIFGLAVFSLFAFLFMIYINNFLISRRKREFGLYAVLGLEKRHIGRVLVWENLLTLMFGVLGGAALALVFGPLLFMVLLKLIHAAGDSSFSLPPIAFIVTGALFFAVFCVTSLMNLVQVRKADPIQLMKSEKKGEKDSVFTWPLAILGAGALLCAYYFAWTVESSGVALGIFFLLVALVIFATYALLRAGSIALLRVLRKNRRLYYKPKNFIAIGGMTQRMKQNARSLATICILSTMLVVTVSGTLALYIGKDEMNAAIYPYDVKLVIHDGADITNEIAQEIDGLAAQYGLTLSADPDKLIYQDELEENGYNVRNNVIQREDTVHASGGVLRIGDNQILFDTQGDFSDQLAFEEALNELAEQRSDSYSIGVAYSAMEEGYGVYGGLVFLGAFFGLMFLAVTVLIIYFKQISEGYEDRTQFGILQKVGMDDAQVRSTIDRQVLWVFFIPLMLMLLHMVFESKIMSCMLQVFELHDWALVIACIGGVCAVFALVYLVVYRLTAKVYYRIVKS